MMEAMFKVLAEFFFGVAMVAAHWYRVLDPDEEEADCQLIKSTFPSLATLMMMDHSYMLHLFLELGLVKKKMLKDGYKYYASRDSWDCFISSEKNLCLETTSFAINRKRHVYISVGTWGTAKTPASIWKAALQRGNNNIIPRPEISTIAIRLAASIARLYTPVVVESSASANSSSAEGESEDEEDSDSCTNNDYSFLHHLQVNISDKPVHDQLVHEILKYNGGSCIHYTQKSNHRGALFRVPSMSSSKQYRDHLGRKHNFMEKIIYFMGESMNDSSGREVAKCLLQYLHDMFEQEYKDIAASNNISVLPGKKWMQQKWRRCYRRQK